MIIMANQDIETDDVATPATATTTSDDESDAESVELLVTGRERRKTAGNRYDRDTVVEEVADAEEDEVALLFAEQDGEDDEEFRSEASDDDQMSSSDDDDQGPNAAPEDLEGEQELQKQAKQDRAKKRKAELSLTTKAGLRKRPRIDPTTPKPIPKKPSKKKERVTWLPDPDNANARGSLRKQTLLHREHTLARLKESEAQSKKIKAQKEKRDREKAKNAPKALTQADRLAEAERIERRNAKSLNRWEAMEKKRNQEQAAKLAALKDRKLEGPVISWRSTRVKFRRPRHPVMPLVVDVPIEDAPKKRGRKSKAYHEQMASLREATEINMRMRSGPSVQTPPPYSQLPSGMAVQHGNQSTSTGPFMNLSYTPQQMQPHRTARIEESTGDRTAGSNVISDAPSQPLQPPNPEPDAHAAADVDIEKQTLTAPSEPMGMDFLHGIHEYAAQTEDTDKTLNVNASPHAPEGSTQSELQHKRVDQLNPGDSVPAGSSSAAIGASQPTNGLPGPAFAPAQLPDTPLQMPSTGAVQDADTPSSLGPTSMAHPATLAPTSATNAHHSLITVVSDNPAHTTSVAAAPEIPMEEGFMASNVLALQNFDDLSSDEKQEYGIFFSSRRSTKPTKTTSSICPITLQRALYRDPATGIGYANMYAYQTLQELGQHKFTWSSMLGCYVGRQGAPIARGALEGFAAK
jgi:vacuolar protein sorting-associated protein 72